MIIPQFTLRWLLAITSVCAGYFMIANLAAGGSTWAAAVTLAIGSLVLILALQAVMFFVVWLASRVRFSRGSRLGESPFKSGGSTS